MLYPRMQAVGFALGLSQLMSSLSGAGLLTLSCVGTPAGMACTRYSALSACCPTLSQCHITNSSIEADSALLAAANCAATPRPVP